MNPVPDQIARERQLMDEIIISQKILAAVSPFFVRQVSNIERASDSADCACCAILLSEKVAEIHGGKDARNPPMSNLRQMASIWSRTCRATLRAASSCDSKASPGTIGTSMSRVDSFSPLAYLISFASGRPAAKFEMLPRVVSKIVLKASRVKKA